MNYLEPIPLPPTVITCNCGLTFEYLSDHLEHSRQMQEQEVAANPKRQKKIVDAYGNPVERPLHDAHWPLPVESLARRMARAYWLLNK